MPSGHVLMFKTDKGYGFIKPDDGSSNVYVHISSLQASGIDALQEGQKITYDLQDEAEKISAVNLKLI